MSYNPDLHHRRSIRLKGYDYAQAGAYFVTINLEHRLCLFGEIKNGAMNLNPAGKMVLRVWEEIPQKYPGVDIDAFVVMPNHIHGIIVLGDLLNQLDDNHVGVGLVPTLAKGRATTRVAPTLGDVIGGFKSITTNQYIKGVKTQGWPAFNERLWQRNYHERILRDEDELNVRRNYIIHNPLNWNTDEENPDL